MTNKSKKISDLPSLSPASLDTTYVVGISGSTTYKISINQLTSSLDSVFATDLAAAALSSSNAIMYQTASAASTWTFNHFLATKYPIVNVYDNNDNIIIPQSIVANNSSSLTITFSSPRTGTAVASKGGYVGSAVGNATTANALATGRLINNTLFDGTQNITIPNLVSGSTQISLAGTSDYNSLFAGIASSTASLNIFTSSINIWSSSLATTGSNIFRGNQTITGSLFVSGTILQNSGALAVQDGTILYHNIRWFTPTSTVTNSGATVTSVGTQFTSGMVGAKLTISGESKIITAFSSNTIVTVDSAYSQNYSAVTASNWGVFSKSLTMAAADNTTLNGGFEIRNSTNGSLITAVYDRIQIGLRLADSGNNVAFNTTGVAQAFQLANDKTLVWYSGSSSANNALNTSVDTGLRKNSPGVLEIYDGNTADGAVANRRDLILRNITGSNATFSGSFNITGSLTMSGDITPSADNIRSLGKANFDYNTVWARKVRSSGGLAFQTDSYNLYSGTSFTEILRINAVSSSFIFQNGGTFNDNGYRIQINASGSASGSLFVSGSSVFSGSINISSGSITMPNRPAFRVYGAGGATSAITTLSGSMTTIDYNQGGWDNTTGTFTAPIAGLYQVNLVCRTNSNSGSAAQIVVFKNNTGGVSGTAQVMIEWASNTSMNHTGGSTISKLAVGDTLKAVVSVGTITFDANDNFSVAYIG
jgi:hypothetical protein